MEHFIIPENYQPALSLHDTQVGIKTVKDFFQKTLSDRLNLLRVSAPLFVDPSSGLNDNLNGVERPVTFDIKESPDQKAEIVHSLAKWKRYALKKYGFAHGEGLYTDMVAIRRDEDTDNIHSIYVDQWDWEKIITREERNVDTLKDVVRTVYSALKKTEKYMAIQYDYIEEILPKDIFFITSQELEDMYPGLSPKDREYKIVKEKGGELPLLLVLDQIQDPGNLGTIVRTAEGAGVTGIVMSQDCVDMYNPKVVRSTMGAAYRVPFCYVDDLAEEVKQMKEAGICTYAAHLEGKNSYDEEDYRKASAFLIGNEGNGLRDEVADQAQVYIRIPMKGQVESLNAAVATAILTFEAARQRR